MDKIGKLATDIPGAPYTWRNGLVCYKNRVVIPLNSPIIKQLLREFHDSPIGGHSGVLRTYKRLAQQFYWPSMFQIVQDYVSSCDVCQRVKSETLAPAGLLQPLPIPCLVWDDITMDFIEGLPTSNGKNTILVVVDRLSKSAHFLALAHPFIAKMVAEKFVEGVVKLHGMPKSIISDRDLVFMSQFWQEFFKLSGIQLKMSSSYHPQTDGQSEVVNRCVEQYLRCYAHHHPRKWSFFLPWAEFWYNTTYHASTGMTPFQALYGRLPPTIPNYLMGTTPVHAVDQNLTSRNAILRQLKTNLHAATNRMKQVVDSKRRNIEYQKLGEPNNTTVELPLTDDEEEIVLEPEGILDTRSVKKGSRIFEESLVKWKRLPLDDATWEDTKMLQDRFINVNLEDKVPVQDRGIDELRRSQRVPKKNPRFIT
uniref:Transposon Tf2-8 polyprotein n=1 Tax=Vitis vinifera TaxID=29760 RepID=A5C2E1_VITVI|nr:hypothetical protein VITISV_035857 [Vitis vinifera]